MPQFVRDTNRLPDYQPRHTHSQILLFAIDDWLTATQEAALRDLGLVVQQASSLTTRVALRLSTKPGDELPSIRDIGRIIGHQVVVAV